MERIDWLTLPDTTQAELAAVIWALPKFAEVEHARGLQLTDYRWRGSDSDKLTFVPDKA